MKTIYRLFIYLLLINVITVFTSCDDFSLDLQPESSLTDASYWKTSKHWESHMYGIHSRLRTHQEQLLRLGEYRSDIWGEQAFTGNTVEELTTFMNLISEDNPGITGFAGFYTNINQINLIIDKTLNTNVLSDNEKNYYLGQAYGLRAFYYFHLLRSWGDVVIQETPSYSFKIDELEKGGSPASQVMEFIKQDIENSLKYFGNNYTFKNKVLWSVAATLMLKSEVFLWDSRQMEGGKQSAQVAKNTLSEIQIKIPSLKLLPTFRDVFKYSNKENDEIIFAIRNEVDEYLGFWSSYVARDIHFSVNHRDSLTGAPYTPQTHNILTIGGGLMRPINTSIYNKFHPDDTRKYESIQVAYLYSDGNYEQLPGAWQNKFQGSFLLGLRVWSDDYPIYRYSDLLLMLAETKSLLEEDPTNEINMVRKRAFGEKYDLNIHGYPNQPVDANIDQAILKERLFEFIAEGKRWYDLRRFGVEYVTKYTNANPERLLWPIDLATLTRNRALKQTPGY